MKKDILNIKLVEIPIISGSQGNKKLIRCHLSNREKGVRKVHAVAHPLATSRAFNQATESSGLTLTAKT